MLFTCANLCDAENVVRFDETDQYGLNGSVNNVSRALLGFLYCFFFIIISYQSIHLKKEIN